MQQKWVIVRCCLKIRLPLLLLLHCYRLACRLCKKPYCVHKRLPRQLQLLQKLSRLRLMQPFNEPTLPNLAAQKARDAAAAASKALKEREAAQRMAAAKSTVQQVESTRALQLAGRFSVYFRLSHVLVSMA